MDQKKVIIGISSYAGSDTTSMLKAVRCLLSREHKKMKMFSLKNYKRVKTISEKIKNQYDENTVYVIRHIRTVEDLDFFKREFNNQDVQPFQAVGINVDWEDCFENFKRRGDLPEDIDKAEWRRLNEAEKFRNEIVKCFDEIKVVKENIYHFAPKTSYAEIGRLTDTILLMF